MDQFAGPAVAVGPERAFRADTPMVLDVFFMWATEDRLWHHHREGIEARQEGKHLLNDLEVVTDVTLLTVPFVHFRGVANLVFDNRRNELGCTAIVGNVAGQRADRVTESNKAIHSWYVDRPPFPGVRDSLNFGMPDARKPHRP